MISKEIDTEWFEEFFQAHFDDIKCDSAIRSNAFIEAIDEAICAWQCLAVGVEVLSSGIPWGEMYGKTLWRPYW